MKQPSLDSLLTVQTDLEAAGITDAVMDISEAIMGFTQNIPAPMCLMADVVAVYTTASMITEIMDQEGQPDVDGVDFAGIANLLRSAADKYQEIGERLAN